jgi:MFS family permease
MSQAPVASGHDPYAPLRIANFRWFVAGILTMAMGAQIQGVVVAWQMYALTNDPLALGMVGLAEAGPFIGLALYAGHVADVRDRRRVALVSLAVLFACAAALGAASLFLVDHAAGDAAAWVKWSIYGVIVICGAARSFLLPARNALQSELVPRPLLPSAVAWRAGIWQVAAVTGPALGGICYGWIGPTSSYIVAAVLMALAFVTVARIRVAARPAVARKEPLLASVRAGLAFLATRRVFIGAITLDLIAVLFGGAVAILPIFANDILHVGPQGLGTLRAAPAIGAVLMSGWLALRPPFRRAGHTFLIAVAVFGLFTIAFALSRWFWLSMALLAAAGAADMLSIFFRSTLMQVMVPTEMLGRVSAVNQIFVGSSNEIGAFESGVSARLMGAVPSVVFGGVVTVVVTAFTAWRFPALRRLDRFESHDAGDEWVATTPSSGRSSR